LKIKGAKVLVNLSIAALLIWFLVSHQQSIRATVASRDSIQYWATGKLLLHHQNPYSVRDVEALERSAGYSSNRPLMFRCPPWALWIVLLPGLLTPYWAWVVWVALLLSSLVVSLRMIWRMYGNGRQSSNAFLLTGYLLAPVPACLVAGQVGLLLLLGITLFFAWEDERPFWAGTALILPMVKPHIFALLWPILGVWILARRKWWHLAGLCSAFAVAMAITVAFDPAAFVHYNEMLRQQAIQNEFIPALSGMIRALFFHQRFWVQFVPLTLGLLWSAWYFWRNRETWKWRQHGPALLVVAILTTPYAWMTDETVVLPAMLQAVVWITEKKLKVRSQLAILLFVILNFLLLLIVAFQIPPATGIYFWSSLVWLSWYLYARTFVSEGTDESAALDAQTQVIAS
jgi:Glycosyltransferase family 87